MDNIERKTIKVPAGTYNAFCWKLRGLPVDRIERTSNGVRSRFYNKSGELLAEYDMRKDHGLVYQYIDHSLTGKILHFPL